MLRERLLASSTKSRCKNYDAIIVIVRCGTGSGSVDCKTSSRRQAVFIDAVRMKHSGATPYTTSYCAKIQVQIQGYVATAELNLSLSTTAIALRALPDKL